MIRVAHLIHTTGIGGVETAAELMSSSTTAVGYQVLAFEQIDPAGVSADFAGSGVNSPRAVMEMLIRLHRMSPDVVVSSLWRSVIVGGLNRLWHPHISWVIFIHNSRYTHLVDRLVHRVAFRFADRILCDSAAALDALVPMSLRSRAEVVCPDSALLHLARGRACDETGTDKDESRVTQWNSRDEAQPVRLIYWGRAVAQKRLDRSLELLSALEELRPGGFSLEIIAPSSGLLTPLLESAGRRGLPVTWHGAATPEEILARAEGARFFVQLSDFEGLAMSVREALALGIIPVVTPVGAIRSYTEDGANAIHLRVPSSPEKDSSAGGSSEISAAAYARTASRIVVTSEDRQQESAMARAARSVSGNDYVTEFETALLSVTGLAPTAEVNEQ